jgi:hypothetical protein
MFFYWRLGHNFVAFGLIELDRKKIGGKQEPVLNSDLYIHVCDMPKKHILISSMFSIVLSK